MNGCTPLKTSSTVVPSPATPASPKVFKPTGEEKISFANIIHLRKF
jgi:hypothetical protein